MADTETKVRSRRVPTRLQRVTAKRARGARPQLDLFEQTEPNTLVLYLLAPRRMRAFADTIATARPRYVFDLRQLPSFEGAGLTRKILFRTMESYGSTYVDAMGWMGRKDRADLLLRSGAFHECVAEICGRRLAGPMFFLFKSHDELRRSSAILPNALQPAPRGGWRVQVYGNEETGTSAASAPSEGNESMSSGVQPWTRGEIVYVVASADESTGWLLDEHGRPTDPVKLTWGSKVRVEDLRIGQWTDVIVLAGHHRGRKVRLASNAHVARLMK
jgi:hypothetical protein